MEEPSIKNAELMIPNRWALRRLDNSSILMLRSHISLTAILPKPLLVKYQPE
jgi:hypothetical protein